MSNYNSLKSTIDANVKQNGVQAITGQVLNSVLNSMVNTLGTGYSFAGVATTATNPGSPDAKVFYIANGKGTYTNFGGIQVTEDDVVVLYWDSSWHKMQTGIASQNLLSTLDVAVNGSEYDEIIAEMDSAQHLTNVFVPNTLSLGEEYFCDVVVLQATWMKIGFSKVGSGTPSSSDVLYIKQTATIGEYNETGIAPDPSVYPYIIYQKNGAENPTTAKLYKKISVSGLEEDFSNIESRVSDLDLKINGREDELIVEMDSNPHTSYAFIPNPLMQGDEFRAEMSVTSGNWTRLLFSKIGAGSPTSSDYLEILQKNALGTYEIIGIAPDPSVYPYITYQKNGAANTSTAKLFKSDYQEGLIERVDKIQESVTISDNINVLLIVNGLWVYNGVFSQNSSWVTKYIYAKRGYKYFVNAQTATMGLQISICKSVPAPNIPTQLIKGGVNDTILDAVIDVNEPCFIAVSSGKTGNVEISIKEEITKSDEVRVQALPLSGRKVLMFGDSITQLPLDAADGAKGISEYFSDVTGADAIRSGFGGSHLRARRIVNSVDDIDLNDSSIEMQEHAKATLDLVYIVRSLCQQDFSLQDKAMEWYSINRPSEPGTDVDAGWQKWAEIIDMLKSLDMSTVNAFTIFIGTNDYSNNVRLNDEDKTPAESTNIQRENGAWNYVLENLSTYYPTIPIFIFTPIVRMDATTYAWIPDTPNGAGLTLRQYAENTISAAKRFYIPVCDLMEELGWNQFNFWSFFNSGDGTHPRKGFQHIGVKMASFVTSHWNRY